MRTFKLFIVGLSVVGSGLLAQPTQAAPAYCDYQSPIKDRVSIYVDKENRVSKKSLSLSTSEKTDVRAAEDGTVVKVIAIEASDNYPTMGKVRIKHANKTSTLYGNFSSITVQEGDEVMQGDTIGTNLGSDYSLEFGVKRNGKFKSPRCIVDPEREILMAQYTVVDNKKITNVIKYPVSSDYRKFKRSTNRHKKIWKRFKRLIPQEYRTHIAGYDVFTDGSGNTLAYVVQDDDNPEVWRMAVDIKDSFRNYKKKKLNSNELNYTLIHEYAHILTLSRDEVDYYAAEAECTTHYTYERCTRADSYFHAFFTNYWEDIYDEQLALNDIIDDDEYYEAVDDFYFNYEDYFVTEYAATNPGEDIAESFTSFVTQDRPTSLLTRANEKIDFFYNYPELVTLRDDIRSGLNGNTVQTVDLASKHSRERN